MQNCTYVTIQGERSYDRVQGLGFKNYGNNYICAIYLVIGPIGSSPQAFTRKCEAELRLVLGRFILGNACPYKEAYHRLLIDPLFGGNSPLLWGFYPRSKLCRTHSVCDLCNCFQGWIPHLQGPCQISPSFVMQPKWT